MNKNEEIIKVKYDIRHMAIKLNKFYLFFNDVMNSLQIFLDEEQSENLKNSGTPFEDETLCVICCERKNSIILKCYV